MLNLKVNEINVNRPVTTRLELNYLKEIAPYIKGNGFRFTDESVPGLIEDLTEFFVVATENTYMHDAGLVHEMLTDAQCPWYMGKSPIWEHRALPRYADLVNRDYVSAHLTDLMPNRSWTPLFLPNQQDLLRGQETYGGYDLASLSTVMASLGVALRAFEHGDTVRYASARKTANV